MFVFIRTLLFALAGLAFALIAGLSSSSSHVAVSQPTTPELSVETVLAALASSTPSTATTTEKVAKIVTKATSTPITSAPKVTPPPAPSTPTLSEQTLNTLARNAIVNILCITKASGPLNSISASGVIIDPRGTIITNSHVGQYFLLRDYPSPNFVECTIRTGSPAQPKYTAELLFLPPSWIADNAQKINQSKPTGNGEHDYAFLRITGTVNPNIPLPATFPFLPVSTTPADTGDSILAAGYPAGFLGGIAVQKDLYASSAVTTVGDVFTFGADTIDLFSLGGSIVAQQGASGGAAVSQSGALMGIIVTATQAPDTASRDLRAIESSYIIRDFKKEAGVSIQEYLGGDTALEAQDFNERIAPALTQKLINVIENR